MTDREYVEATGSKCWVTLRADGRGKVHLKRIPWARSAVACGSYMCHRGASIVKWADKAHVTCRLCLKTTEWHKAEPWSFLLPPEWEPFDDSKTALILADWWDEKGTPKASHNAKLLRQWCDISRHPDLGDKWHPGDR